MNKNPLAVALATAGYSMLFFKQNAGVNFLVFNLIIILLLVWKYSTAIKLRDFRLAVTLCLFSSVFIMINGSSLAVLANIVSLMILSAVATGQSASVIMHILQATYSIAVSAIKTIASAFSKNAPRPGLTGARYHGVITYLIPASICLIFFAIYRQANPLFAEFTKTIRLDFITIDWVVFTLGGLVLCCGAMLHRRSEPLDKLEMSLQAEPEKIAASTAWNQQLAFFILMILLNLMILLINLLDVRYLYLGSGLPVGITHKQFVHNGVGMLMLSILLGISLLLYFLKRIPSDSILLKILVIGWIVQNLFMIVSTAMRNDMYIREALLTYKRIGVYYWLAFACVGLITTYYKWNRKKNIWFIFRVNALAAWIILVLSTAIDWDMLISRYNIRNCKPLAALDKKYLLSISHGNLNLLYKIRDREGFNTDSVYHYSYRMGSKNRALLDEKMLNFELDNKNVDWRSFNFRRQRISKKIGEMKMAGAFNKLDLTTSYSSLDLAILSSFPQLEELHLYTLPSDKKHCECLGELPHLTTIGLVTMNYSDTLCLDQLPQIQLISTNADSITVEFFRKRFPGTLFQKKTEK